MMDRTVLSARSGLLRPFLPLILPLLLSLCAGLLTACGGGGDGGNGKHSSTEAAVTLTASAASVAVGQPVTLTWSTQNSNATKCTASGAWSGEFVASGSQEITPAVPAGASVTYSLTCGDASGSVSVAVAATVNTIPVEVDGGPAKGSAFNIPFVSVTVCRPGTNVCQTIDHVMVDTASYGLRLVTPLNASLALPAVKVASGSEVGECSQFISGYTWGAIVQADVKLGGEVASALSIQTVGRAPGSANGTPSECSGIGNNIGTVAALGANGILGVGPFTEDCGLACVINAPSAAYYACSNGNCSPTSIALEHQVRNPIPSFATDNNGLILSLPAVSAQGATSLTGTLTFGIGTQSNNALASVTVYPTDSLGNVTTVYKGARMNSSFIDSGSNGLYFIDRSIPSCSLSTVFYCPNRALTLNATIVGADGKSSPAISFTVQNIDSLPAEIVVASVGGSGSNPDAFDWGLPFFFGRKVYMGLGTDTKGPYWAF